MTASLEDYAGRKVAHASLEIRGTGAGLDRSMVMPPIALPLGETVDIVLRCSIDKHRHEYDDEDGTLTLVNIVTAETATIADQDGMSVKELLATAEQRVAERKAALEAAKRSADGEDPLPFTSEQSDDPDRIGLARPDLDAAEQAIRDRAANTKQVDCPRCSGEGQVNDDGTWVDCPRCAGEGVVPDDGEQSALDDVTDLEDAANDHNEDDMGWPPQESG